MVQAIERRSGAGRHRALWASTQNHQEFNLKRAVIWASLVETALVAGLLSLNFDVRFDAPPNPTIMRPVAPDAAPPDLLREPQEPVKRDVKTIVKLLPAPDAAPPAVNEFARGDDPAPVAVAIPGLVAEPAPGIGAGIGTVPPTVRRGIAPIFRVEPGYPRSAHRAGTEGHIVAHLHIRADGVVERVEVVQTYPRGVFDREAIAALLQWRFAPEQVGFVGEVEIVFKLASG